MRVGCYSVDLYCTGRPEDKWHTVSYATGYCQFIGRTEAECLREAKKLGWKIVRDKELCPDCKRAGLPGKGE